MTIRRKLIAWIAGPTLIIYAVVLGFTLQHLNARNRKEVQRVTTQLATHYAGLFDGHLREAEGIAESTARFLETARFEKPQLYAQLRANLKQNPLVFGAAIAFEPGTFPGESDLFAPYVCRAADELREVNIDRSVYDWHGDPQYTWFRAPKEAGQSLWSDPYFDEGAGNILMCTYSAPFFFNGTFAGVTTVDIDITRLRETVGKRILDGHDFAVFTSRGQYVYSPYPERIMRKTLFDMARELGSPEIQQLAQRVTSGKAGVTTVRGWDTPERQWAFYAPIESAGWMFVCRVPEREILADVRSRMVFAAGGLGISLLLIVGCIVAVSSYLARPITTLTEKVLEVARGNLDARAEGIRGNDEVATLARSFNKMTADLRNHVESLAAERAERQKIEHDLDVAREIQRGLLPEHKPELAGFDLAGWNKPADKTGGDYYDWQTLPDGRVAISIADATGHGIGPALVTAVCRAYSRASLPSDTDLGQALQRINDLLVEDLTAGRFVTFVVALADPRAAQVRLLSAGHGPIFFYKAAEKQVHQFNADNIPFGIAANIPYGPASDLAMGGGDILVLITDGFFEWANASGEQFGEERLSDVIRASASMSAEQIIARLTAAVLAFAGGTEQQDDLTVVVLKRA